MADPYVPHLIGVTLDGTGVAGSKIAATNRSNGNILRQATNSDKVAIFDLSNMPDGYSASDVIQFENVGASFGGTTVTVNSATGGFQEGSITCTAAPTGNLSL